MRRTPPDARNTHWNVNRFDIARLSPESRPNQEVSIGRGFLTLLQYGCQKVSLSILCIWAFDYIKPDVVPLLHRTRLSTRTRGFSIAEYPDQRGQSITLETGALIFYSLDPCFSNFMGGGFRTRMAFSPHEVLQRRVSKTTSDSEKVCVDLINAVLEP